MARFFKFFGKSIMTRRHLDDCDWSTPLSIPKKRREQTPGYVTLSIHAVDLTFLQIALATSCLPRRDPAQHLGLSIQGGLGDPVACQQTSRQYRPANSSQGSGCSGADSGFGSRRRNRLGEMLPGGQVDSIVALLVALTPRVRTIYLGEDFSVEVLLFEPQRLTASNTSSLHKFEDLRDVAVNNHAATYYHRRFDFTNVFQSFFHLHMLDRLYTSGSFPEDSRPVLAGKKLEHLSRLDLKRIGEAELEQILSLAPNLKNLAYTYAWHSKAGDISTQPLTLPPSHGTHTSPLRYVIPKSVVFLSLTDDLHRQPYWGWNIKDIKQMVTDYLQYVKEPWLNDPAVIPISFRKEIMESYRRRTDDKGNAKFGERPLKMGVLWCDGMVGVHLPVLRGLKVVVEALKKAGHKGGFLSADGAHDIHQHLNRSGEPLIPDLRDGLKLKTPTELLKYQDLTIQGLEFERQYSDYWNSTADSDGILPVSRSDPVLRRGRADKKVDVFDERYKPLGEKDRENWEAYDADAYDGAPVGLQIVGRKFEEEKCLAIGRIVDAVVQNAIKTA
ncbi:amidase signature domain-containing protein [Fusarium sp. MPI-SDFR-AT-0072]|nr:amidase signature domain-containing protein [Fusarium sp. MPI-SDFR-AT-0072]